MAEQKARTEQLPVVWPEPRWRVVQRTLMVMFGVWLVLTGLRMIYEPLMYLVGGAGILVAWYGMVEQARAQQARYERQLMQARLFGPRRSNDG